MNAEIQSRIFEPFFTTKEVGRGVGLGLASVYGTVESHKGFIEVASQQEKGSAFTMYFPACDVPSLERQGRVPEESKAESITVLVVDDEEIVAHAFEALLSAMGHKVTLCTRGDEAILLYREHASEIDLVVLGSKLRDMSGEQCFRELKKLDTQVKILIASGEHPGSVGERLLLEGVLGFVSKPVNAEELQRTIKRAMDM
jgi:CheY-like chemotaxis protein